MPFSHIRLITSICEPLCIWTHVSTYVLDSHAKYKLSISLLTTEQQIEHKMKRRKKQRNNFYHQLYMYWPDGRMGIISEPTFNVIIVKSNLSIVFGV